jgi:hypothetical protein
VPALRRSDLGLARRAQGLFAAVCLERFAVVAQIALAIHPMIRPLRSVLCRNR